MTDSIKITMSKALYNKLMLIGILDDTDVRSDNVGKSDYSKHVIQPWSIIKEYNLNYWDGDIIKRILRTKEGETRALDYTKIIHICKERLRQITVEQEINRNNEVQE